MTVGGYSHSRDFAKFMLKQLQCLQKQDTLCDLVLKTDSQHEESSSFSVHKIVLYMTSRYFRSQLDQGIDVRGQYVVPNTDSTCLKNLVNFMYTGNLYLSADTLTTTSEAASYLQIDLAETLCAEFKNNGRIVRSKRPVQYDEDIHQDVVDQVGVKDAASNDCINKCHTYDVISNIKQSDPKSNHEIHGSTYDTGTGIVASTKRNRRRKCGNPRKLLISDRKIVWPKCRKKKLNLVQKSMSKMMKVSFNGIKNRLGHFSPKYSNQYNIPRHWSYRHNGSSKNRFECTLCPDGKFTLYTRLLQHYQRQHNINRKYRCKTCSRTYRSYMSLKSHTSIKHKHQGTSELYKCNDCHRPFMYKKNLEHHLSHTFVTKTNVKIKSRDCEFPAHSRSYNVIYKKHSFRCEDNSCNFKTRNRQTMRHHMAQEHPGIRIPCPITDCRYKGRCAADVEYHIQGKHDQVRGVLCDLCSSWFPKSNGLRIHMFVKHKIKLEGIVTYECGVDGCNYETVSKNAIEKHKSYRHAVASYRCQYCEKILKTELTLQKHINKMHLGIRPYLCTICGQAFGEEYDLKHHEQRHKVKEFKCTQCLYTSASDQDYNNHMFSAHKIKVDTNVKVHQCPMCSYSTLIKSRLKNHMESHNKTLTYCCQKCGKLFKTERTLKKHVSFVHTPKAYPCSFCGHVARSLHHIKEHCRVKHTHKNLKPYKCGYCDFHSATTGNCRKHVMARHKGLEVLYVKVEELPKLGPPRSTISISDDADNAMKSQVAQVTKTVPDAIVGNLEYAMPSVVNNTSMRLDTNPVLSSLQHPSGISTSHILLGNMQAPNSIQLVPNLNTGLQLQMASDSLGYIPQVYAASTYGHNQQPYSGQIDPEMDIQLGALVNSAISNTIHYTNV